MYVCMHLHKYLEAWHVGPKVHTSCLSWSVLTYFTLFIEAVSHWIWNLQILSTRTGNPILRVGIARGLTYWVAFMWVPEIQTQDLTLAWQWVVSLGLLIPFRWFLPTRTVSYWLFLLWIFISASSDAQGKKSILITLRVKMATGGWRRRRWDRKSGFSVGLRASGKALPHLP